MPGGSGPDPWLELFKQLICDLYKVFGGDCDDLDWGDGGSTAVGTVRDEFDTNGLPTLSSQEEQDLRDLLDSLEDHINLGTATISQTLKDTVHQLIDDIRDALDA